LGQMPRENGGDLRMKLSALTLLIGFCIVGSIVAALRPVIRGSVTVITRK
jgi:hypothetical protein